VNLSQHLIGPFVFISFVNNNGGSVMIPYCRVDKEISLERVRHELQLLEVETLLKKSFAKMHDSGKYS
jgi:hypothetical protein